MPHKSGLLERVFILARDTHFDGLGSSVKFHWAILYGSRVIMAPAEGIHAPPVTYSSLDIFHCKP